MIIGIAGTLGAGKGTVVEYLKEKGFAHYSGSGKLREILEQRGIEVNREAYSKLADEIRTVDPQGLSKLTWEQFLVDGESNAIFEALHDVGEADFIKEKGGIVLAVDAPLETRFARIKGRGSEKDNVTFDEFKKIAIHEEEGGGKHNIRAVVDMADYTITNDGSLEELQAQVEAFLAQFHD